MPIEENGHTSAYNEALRQIRAGLPEHFNFGKGFLEEEAAETESASFNCKWFSDKEKQNKITEAVLGDLVYFTIHCNGVPENTKLKISMRGVPTYLLVPNSVSNFFANSTDLNESQELIVDNGKIESSVFFGLDYFNYIKGGTGINSIKSGIEVYWRVKYNNIEFNISNPFSNFTLEDDEYYRAIAIVPEKHAYPKYLYTCNCGWIDTSHAFGKSKRPPQHKVGADRLWEQIVKENGLKSSLGNGFKVIYTQDVIKLGQSIGITKEYYIKYGLPLDEKERIALTIFQEVSMEFEQFQSWHLTSGSSFEPADLVSNLLGFYSVVRPKLTKEYIIETLCKPVGIDKSIKIYKKYPGTFTISKYKNKKFTPRFFDNEYCKNPVFPKEFQEIKPYPKDRDTFRDWIDLFDIHEGIPPIIGPKD